MTAVTQSPPAEVLEKISNARGRRARSAVLAAATQLFAERGYDGVSLADVAGAAGTTKPSVLYHFTDKDDLWRNCVEDLWSQVQAFYDENWPRDLAPSRRLVERMLELFIEASLRWPAYVRIPFIEGTTSSWRSEWLTDRHFAAHVQTTDRIIRSCQRRGLLPSGDPAHIQALWTSPINVFVAQSAVWDRALDARLEERASLLAYVRFALDLTFRSEGLDNSS